VTAKAETVILGDAPRVALVHEWLVTAAGSEQVLRELRALFPGADLFCVIDGLSAADRQRLGVGRPRTTYLQWLPWVSRYYRLLLPLMPHAIEQLDLSRYDLVISNSHAVAKGVRPRPGSLHLCHCCSPVRYAWDLRERYLSEAGVGTGLRGVLLRHLLERLRRWDLAATTRVSAFVAISQFIAERIQRAYGRSSTVIFPPVDTGYYTIDDTVPRGTHYVTASRLVGYKQIPLIVEAFRALPDRELVVIGDGPDRDRVLAAAGPNVRWMGHQPQEVLRHELRRARAFLFAAEEDFGILPVEAQACGTPVIALGCGGSLETVVASGDHRTGEFFAEATPEAIAAAIRAFEASPPPAPSDCRRNAEQFSTERFRSAFAQFVTEHWERHRTARG
jgi:glycosyltransferase involved in cell wall biosynthesis